jgi:hypothetical protein
MKIRPLGAELLHAERSDKTKPAAAFHNVAKNT